MFQRNVKNQAKYVTYINFIPNDGFVFFADIQIVCIEIRLNRFHFGKLFRWIVSQFIEYLRTTNYGHMISFHTHISHATHSHRFFKEFRQTFVDC